MPKLRDGTRFELEAERVHMRDGGRRNAALRDDRVKDMRDKQGGRRAEQRGRPERVARQGGRHGTARNGRVREGHQLPAERAPEARLVECTQTRSGAACITLLVQFT